MCVDGRTDVSRRCIYETKTLSMRFAPIHCIRFDCQTCANALMATINLLWRHSHEGYLYTNLYRHSVFSIQLQKICTWKKCKFIRISTFLLCLFQILFAGRRMENFFCAPKKWGREKKIIIKNRKLISHKRRIVVCMFVGSIGSWAEYVFINLKLVHSHIPSPQFEVVYDITLTYARIRTLTHSHSTLLHETCAFKYERKNIYINKYPHGSTCGVKICCVHRERCHCFLSGCYRVCCALAFVLGYGFFCFWQKSVVPVPATSHWLSWNRYAWRSLYVWLVQHPIALAGPASTACRVRVLCVMCVHSDAVPVCVCVYVSEWDEMRKQSATMVTEEENIMLRANRQYCGFSSQWRRKKY